MRAPRRRRARSTTARRTSSRWSARRPVAPAWTSCSTWWAATTSAATWRSLAVEGRLVQIAFLRGPAGRGEPRAADAEAADVHRIDAAPAHARRRRAPSRGRCTSTSGRASSAASSGRSSTPRSRSRARRRPTRCSKPGSTSARSCWSWRERARPRRASAPARQRRAATKTASLGDSEGWPCSRPAPSSQAIRQCRRALVTAAATPAPSARNGSARPTSDSIARV